MNEREIFTAALQQPEPIARAAYLAEACGDDTRLRERVRALLAEQERMGTFMESPSSLDTLDPPISEAPGTQIGSYKLLEQIGEGGFGIVFMAEQTQPLRRKVALKVLKPGMDSRQVIARFEAERQALALMDHPNIARVFDSGATPSGRPYFVMELVKGVPITEFSDQNQLTLRERLELFISVCQAVQHAHQKGIIHRDLKPANVLVTVHDTRPVAKVIDFGVAKALGQELTEKTMFTGFAEMVGTPIYMSPEQAGKSGLDIDTRSDVYSLGVLLYELLTGTTPFSKERLKQSAYEEIRRIIREEDPPTPSTRLSELGRTRAVHPQNPADGQDGQSGGHAPPHSSLTSIAALRKSEPRKLTNLLRGELDWIVMKCLEKDRNRRYETASALAADVQRYLSDEPVHACPPSAWYRFRKFARRHKAGLLSGSAMALVVFAAAAGSTGVVWQGLQRERRDSYIHRIDMVHNALSADNLSRALKYLDECPKDLRGWEWHYLMRSCRAEPLVISVTTGVDTTAVHSVAFNPDGELLASAGGDGTITIWNSRTGKLIQTFQKAHSGSVVSVAFHPGGQYLASRGTSEEDSRVKVWDLTSGKELFNEPCDEVRKFGTAYTIAFSPNGRLLAAGTAGVVKIWDWKNHRLLPSCPGHGVRHAIPVAFSRDSRLAAGTWRDGVKLWNPETGKLLRTFEEHKGPLSAVAFSADTDSKWVASASYDRTVKLSDSTTGERLYTLSHPGNQVECVAIAPDGRRLASGCEDKTVRVWDTTTGREVLVLRGHTDRCGCVAFSPDSHRLASASFDGTIRIWDGTPLGADELRQELLTFTEHTDEIRAVAFSPDGGQIVSAGSDKLVKVWDVQTRQRRNEFSHEELGLGRVGIFCLAWQGHLIASGGLDGVRVWDARTGEGVFPLLAAEGKIGLPICAVAFSPDGRYLVSGKDNGAVQIWDGKTGALVGPLDTHEGAVFGLVFSPDGAHLASASRDGIVKLWDATRLNQKQAVRRKFRARVPGPSVNVAFSPDGRKLVTGGERNTIKIWDVEKSDEPLALPGHSGEVYTIAVSTDVNGQWMIASGGEDSTVKVWDGPTGKLLHTFRGHLGLVCSLAFSRDGKRLVSGSRDTMVKIWDMTQLETVTER